MLAGKLPVPNFSRWLAQTGTNFATAAPDRPRDRTSTIARPGLDSRRARRQRNAMDAIHVQALTKRYGATLAVDDISFRVRPGQTVGLLGGNGAGKSTTIAMLLGILVPTAGRIDVLGHDMARDRFRALARMNFSSPYIALPGRLSVRENLRVYGHLYSVRNTDRRIAELAEELSLGDFLDRPAGELSAGQKTRVALAKSLINRPELLLLDEPTASLDPDTGDMVRSWLERYRTVSGCSMLLASHNMAEVERLCDHILMLQRGRIVDEGSPEALLARYDRDTMEDVFLDIARGRGEGARRRHAPETTP
jgi:ABC-2 type transport system ATP-binding protein